MPEVPGVGQPDAPPQEGPTRRRAIVRALLRPSRTQLVLAVILAVVGLGITLQVRTLNSTQDYSTLRRTELISILDDLTTESRRLEDQIAELERTRQELRSGADRQQVARDEAARRRDELAILAGTAPADGQGVRVVIEDEALQVGQAILLNAISELRDAGAEAIELNDSIRVVASTWVSGDGDELTVDDVLIERPITIDAIGDPHALSEALRFRGGLVSEITSERVGGKVSIATDSPVSVESTVVVSEPRFARPA